MYKYNNIGTGNKDRMSSASAGALLDVQEASIGKQRSGYSLTVCEIVWEAGEPPMCESDEGVVPDVFAQCSRDALNHLHTRYHSELCTGVTQASLKLCVF